MSRQALIDYALFQKEGRRLGREGMSCRVERAVEEWRRNGESYKGAMVLAGRLKAIASMSSVDDYWREQVEKGVKIERDLCARRTPMTDTQNGRGGSTDIVDLLRSDDQWLREAGGALDHHRTTSGMAAAEITHLRETLAKATETADAEFVAKLRLRDMLEAENTALRARVAELEEGLRPFGGLAADIVEDTEDYADDHTVTVTIGRTTCYRPLTLGDLRRARRLDKGGE